MIKLETAHIEELRGIRKLDIDFKKGNFAISGPNGSGKSGVIDAIEFGLTGQIGRLTGRGTKGLSVAEHGPHVDKTRIPGAAFVELRVFLPALGKSATITRKISSPTKPKIVPDDADVRMALAEVADHPEITLSRREILRFILIEPAKRAEEIQTILKLEEIGHTRAALNTAQNRMQASQKTAKAQVGSSRSSLMVHLQIATTRTADLLEAVNKRRKLLELPEIDELLADTKLDAGLAAANNQATFNKPSALRDISALEHASADFPELAGEAATAAVADLERLEGNPALLIALQHRALVEKGLSLVDSTACPLCDTDWEDEGKLRAHLRDKLEKSAEAQKIQVELLKNGTSLASAAIKVQGLLTPVQKLADEHGAVSFKQMLSEWQADLANIRAKSQTLEGLAELKQRLSSGAIVVPPAIDKSIRDLTKKLVAKPDQSASVDAQSFLTTAQIRLDDYREARRKRESAEIAHASAQAAYEIYCEVLEEELNALYDEVEKDFSAFYREINEDDEAKCDFAGSWPQSFSQS